MAREYVGGDESTTQFQKAVAGESELRGKSFTEYNSAGGIKKYRYVYNADTVSKAVGLPCVYIMSNTTYPGGMVVDQPTAASLNYFAGVFAQTCTSGVWTWIQTWGYNTDAITRRYGSSSGSNGLVGEVLTLITTVDALTTIHGSASTTDLGPVNPIAFEANAVRLVAIASHATSTTTSTGTVFLRGYIP